MIVYLGLLAFTRPWCERRPNLPKPRRELYLDHVKRRRSLIRWVALLDAEPIRCQTSCYTTDCQGRSHPQNVRRCVVSTSLYVAQGYSDPLPINRNPPAGISYV